MVRVHAPKAVRSLEQSSRSKKVAALTTIAAATALTMHCTSGSLSRRPLMDGMWKGHLWLRELLAEMKGSDECLECKRILSGYWSGSYPQVVVYLIADMYLWKRKLQYSCVHVSQMAVTGSYKNALCEGQELPRTLDHNSRATKKLNRARQTSTNCIDLATIIETAPYEMPHFWDTMSLFEYLNCSVNLRLLSRRRCIRIHENSVTSFICCRQTVHIIISTCDKDISHEEMVVSQIEINEPNVPSNNWAPKEARACACLLFGSRASALTEYGDGFPSCLAKRADMTGMP
ncbi:hypothetical protein F5050DRAFT_1123309 [Lentinula boryana]|uniref:Uncharacterized protein n=1 Tax=Lentinula boryana TaxID=40481 RepID=A0ABQ8PYS9_9AGAR|nr:hypothetical protein F5050DRAFT_1123309 [Lentinula boryana]